MMRLLTKKRFMVGVAGLLAVVLIAALVVGWVASNKILAVAAQRVEYDQVVVGIDGDRYTFRGSAYNVLGVIGGIRSDGSMVGIFSHPLEMNASTSTSTRTLRSLTGSPLRVGDKLSLQGNIWTSNPKDALGLEYQEVAYNSSMGPMHAWLINGASTSTWTIGVHGIGADKTEMLRFIKPVHDAGNTMLVINYRNDSGNPASPDHINHLGDTEWEDLEAAVKYARSHSATTINLYGDSLGGSVVENYLRRSSTAKSINRVVLDSPALDWEQLLKHRAQTSGYPALIYYPTAIILKLRTGISVARISTHAADIRQQTLIIHSADDSNVPQAASKRLAKERSDKVTLLDFEKGGHLRSWNCDTSRYESAIENFLKN